MNRLEGLATLALSIRRRPFRAKLPAYLSGFGEPVEVHGARRVGREHGAESMAEGPRRFMEVHGAVAQNGGTHGGSAVLAAREAAEERSTDSRRGPEISALDWSPRRQKCQPLEI